jgi:hypothetical protein
MQEYACVFSADIEEGRLAELLLRERFSHTELLSEYDDDLAKNASLLIFDTDTVTPPDDLSVRVITFGREEKDRLPYPFLSRPYSVAAMRALIGIGDIRKTGTVGFYLSKSERTAEIDGEKILLTKQEYALLLRLYEANGEAVSRETLLEELFSERTEESLNVYIRYLRKKLEKNGRRLIFSSRGKGYSLILGG